MVVCMGVCCYDANVRYTDVLVVVKWTYVTKCIMISTCS